MRFVAVQILRARRCQTHLLSFGPALDVYTAAAIGEALVVMREIDRDPALIESYSCDGWTPLHLAAFFGQPATGGKTD